MTNTRFYNLSTRITPPGIVSRFIGPLEGSVHAIWAQLVDFENWNSWMPGVTKVERQDAGVVGRGSILLVRGKLSQLECRIAHWDPSKRLDLVFTTRSKRIGYSITVIGTDDTRHAEVRLEMEFEFNGLGSWLGFLRTSLEKRRASRLLECFALHVQFHPT
ncbi:MAG TPA: hypothetical protein DCM64_07625 [Gammaproteobacteria bacterium]|jgi:hypothetical protein|nr:SRPBCC family protein [Gammaproteobacteria bacterium]MDP6732394.1 SRPBCC family protein [Gammaproteobacteria bacterium]HAJ76310.1 hypothetical protein [Gammaproteobacteria bacterium]|tara:strand:+ start:885 stop:1367 length:483 start_codon:yes stop_codon:yes gene_type:complete